MKFSSVAFTAVGLALLNNYVNACNVLSADELQKVGELRGRRLAEWGYLEEGGDWGIDYALCRGKAQSPIDLPSLVDMARGSHLSTDLFLPALDVSTTSIAGATVVNNGHTLQVNIPGGAEIKLRGANGLASVIGRKDEAASGYRLAQFHYHWGASSTTGSEHTVDGRHGPLEVHFVHYNTDYASLAVAADKPDGLLVVGVVYEVGDANTSLEKVLAQGVPLASGGSATMTSAFSVKEMVSGVDLSQYYLYPGSLTTPGCFESVTWVVMNGRLTASESQLAQLRRMAEISGGDIIQNYREVQPLNDRVVRSSVTQTTNVPAAESMPEQGESAGATVIVKEGDVREDLLIAILVIVCCGIAFIGALVAHFFLKKHK